MAVVSINELHQRRASSTTRTGRKTHTRCFLVVTDDKADGTAVAQDAVLTTGESTTAVPGPGDTYKGVPFASKNAVPVQDSATHFEVTVNYEAPSGSSQQPTTADPLQEPLEVTYGAADATESAFLDHSDPPLPLANSAGDPLEQLPEREAGSLTITLVKNEASYSPIVADEYSHSTNSNPVTIDGITYPPTTLKLSPITATKHTNTVTSGGNTTTTTYFRKTYTLKVRRAGWRMTYLDVGYQELVGDGSSANPHRLIPIVDAAGLPVKKPWPLDGEGRKKPNASDPPATITRKLYAEKDWTPLGFTAAE